MANKKSLEDQRSGAEVIHGAEECFNHSLKLLGELGFPRGVLPLKDLEECGLVRETGFVWMKQKAPYEHFFKATNTLVRYDAEVTAYIEKGKMKKMSGVRSKQLLMWVPIVEMSIEETSREKIYFKTPMGIGRSFPTISFMDEEDKEKHLEEISSFKRRSHCLRRPPKASIFRLRWYNHIEALLRISGVSGEGSGVTVEGSATFDEAIATPPPAADTYSYNHMKRGFQASVAEDDDDDDVDLFGDETEEEKKAAEERAAAVKASGKKKESGKSSVLLDIKPWDDETDMQKLEEAVRSVQMEGLHWGASKLVPVGYDIKKLQIMITIVDDLVSVDNLIEDYLTAEPINEHVQSVDINLAGTFNRSAARDIWNGVALSFVMLPFYSMTVYLSLWMFGLN
ncbi:hypothetical protein BUALT_Bualt02G0089000 [Buddleja alternifolia]|uniref:Translation elongation factor EF1B beta/delta subunit guanine nucleotide exchange domain-containing protein n=1 Tax=Buddleja alternifolia TaxID=168488 RepID=A0AAV6Y9G5_9LAMI|nr:hypothetical protein BUALT_Bualt02G0089000 [Buddleja alternifolia]